VLSYLLPETIDAASLATGSGSLAVQTSASQAFTPPLLNGAHLGWGGFAASRAFSKNLVVQ